MNLYDIRAEIEELIDPESGEISDIEKFEELSGSAEAKLENIAIYIKNLEASAELIQREIALLTERKKKALNKAERLKAYMQGFLNGQKFETAKCKCEFRKSTPLEIEDETKFIEWAKINNDKYLKYSEPSVNKTAVKDDISAGMQVPFAQIVTKMNLSIK